MKAANKYMNVQTQTASKERLMLMLFQAGLRHMQNAIEKLESEPQAAHIHVEKASDIVLELMGTLNHKHAPALCEQLTDLYRFIVLRMTQGYVRKDVKQLREAERCFVPIVEAFKSVAEQVIAEQG